MLTTKHLLSLIVLVAVSLSVTTSCTDDLSTTPLDDDVQTSETVYTSQKNYRQVLAKLYGGFATTGQQGPAGDADIQGIDEGFSSYVRMYWVAQELPTDEAVVGWTDPGLPQYNYQDWTASNDFVMGLYSRIFYQISLANEFIRNAQDSDNEQIQQYLAEARFLRALYYWHALDLYGGNVPFVTEDDDVGAYQPEPTNSDSLFAYIESELKAVTDQLPAPQQNEYGRADRAAAWTVLAKLYLNAETYIGEPHWDEVVTYTKNIIDEGGYTLEDNYQHLFLADNHTADGVIFAVPFDGDHMQTYGGTNFIVHAQVGGNMSGTEDYGIDGGWEGHRVTPQFVNLFDTDSDGEYEENDGRALFFTDGQNKEIADVTNFNDGYAMTKWKNITSDGEPGKRQAFVDTDFPMFRIADIYLMYAEATVRGGQGGSESEAVNLINDLRERAYGDDSGNITSGQLTLDFILQERARELSWEGHRRTDLIRYDLFTSGDYVWAWKGETQEGTATDEIYSIYPLPASDVNSNTNLEQNPGY